MSSNPEGHDMDWAAASQLSQQEALALRNLDLETLMQVLQLLSSGASDCPGTAPAAALLLPDSSSLTSCNSAFLSYVPPEDSVPPPQPAALPTPTAPPAVLAGPTSQAPRAASQASLAAGVSNGSDGSCPEAINLQVEALLGALLAALPPPLPSPPSQRAAATPAAVGPGLQPPLRSPDLVSLVEFVESNSPGLTKKQVLVLVGLLESQQHFLRMTELSAAMEYADRVERGAAVQGGQQQQQQAGRSGVQQSQPGLWPF